MHVCVYVEAFLPTYPRLQKGGRPPLSLARMALSYSQATIETDTHLALQIQQRLHLLPLARQLSMLLRNKQCYHQQAI